jgi:outer membrane protein OmpA-like peptidoglycan-associated protein
MRRLAALAVPLVLLGACAHTVPGTPAAAGQSYVVYFQEWSAGLDDTGAQAVQQAADQARQHPGVPILVTGYAANSTGSSAANELLSRTRAQQVVDKLRADGVEASRIRLNADGATGYQLDPLEARRVSISLGAT